MKTPQGKLRHQASLNRRVVAEAVGTAMLLMAVVGSGIMGERLSSCNTAIALLANSLATGAGLFALILTFGPISGAHFNPAVTFSDASQGGLPWPEVPAYVLGQIGGAFAGVALADMMFGLPAFFASRHIRNGSSDMPSITRGTCYCIFVYDIAFSIDLNEAERRISSAKRETIRHKRRAPKYFEYQPAPLGISQAAESVRIVESFATDTQVELVVYDFGGVTVIYRVPLTGDSSRLLALSEGLYENDQLLADSRRRVEDLLNFIRPAVSKANISTFVEDYIIFQIDGFAEATSVEELLNRYGPHIAQILRAETRQLSADEVMDALSYRISFGKDDVVIVDWNAALVVDKEAEDVLTA